MDRFAKSGWTFEADVGLHVSPAWTLYGLWEYGKFARGTNNTAASSGASMNTLGVGANANTSPHGPVGFLIDGSIGCRWFTFGVPQAFASDGTPIPSAYGSDVTASGAAFRLGMGLAINATRKFRIDLLGSMTFTTFREYKGGGLEGAQPGSNITYGLTAGGRWDL
jgi:hypothetical protein